MLSEAQREEINEKVRTCVYACLVEGLNQQEIEKEHGIPQSSAGRYLSSRDRIKDALTSDFLTSLQDSGIDLTSVDNLLDLIQQKNEENKYKGTIKGGIISQANNGFSKDKDGKFNGSGKHK